MERNVSSRLVAAASLIRFMAVEEEMPPWGEGGGGMCVLTVKGGD